MRFISGKYTSGELLDNVRAVEDWITNHFVERGPVSDEALKSDMSKRLLDISFGRNDCIFDDQGNPSIMVRIPETRLNVLDSSWGNALHPAFIVNNSAVSELWLGKYPAITVGSEASERAVVLRRRDPRVYVTFDQALTACKQKGARWHLTTNAEWAFLLNWCRMNGFWPRGNNSSGRDYSRTSEYGEVIYRYQAGGTWYNGRTATGTGPATWSHDGTPFGIFDLNGNVWEWVGGLRLVDGEIQILENNNAADNTKDQSAASEAWKAIMPDGSLVEPETGGTLKYDATNADGSGNIVLATSVVNQTSGDPYASTAFRNLTARDVAAPALLHQLGLFPKDTNYGTGTVYMRNLGERLPRRGGVWNNTSDAGGPALNLSTPRSHSSLNIGFRPAYYR
ncbi:SUMF1/EgtB/PvdO family nonheme iron enzyme [Candidatus Darwinibacter acetoxidans]